MPPGSSLGRQLLYWFSQDHLPLGSGGSWEAWELLSCGQSLAFLSLSFSICTKGAVTPVSQVDCAEAHSLIRGVMVVVGVEELVKTWLSSKLE